MIKIGDKCIGDGFPTFITFEAGPTHAGFEEAKILIEQAASCGADAVKFQIFDPDELIADKSQLYSYEVLIDRETGEKELVSEPLYDIFCRRALGDSEWLDLKKFADECNIVFFATIGDERGLSLVKKMGCDSVKIASADLNYTGWLRRVAQLGNVVQIDTGNATFGEIETAVDILRSNGSGDFIIHNCPSGYPAKLESINLRMIPTLKSLFGCPVAYSDHSPGDAMDIAAIAIGANMVEKTITMDRTTRSVEHIMSIEGSELENFVSTIRNLEVALGNPRRLMSESEREARLAVRRSLVLDQDVCAGQSLDEVKYVFKRPGFGVPPDAFTHLLTLRFKKPLKKGHLLTPKDLE